MDLAKLRVLYTSEGLSQLNTEFTQLRAEADKNFGAIGQTAGLAMTAVGGAITGALGLCTKSALDFEKGLRNVGTLGVQDLQALRDGVLEYSATMGQDATTATRDLYDILSQGIPEQNALAILESSAKGAAAGVGTVSDALKLGTSVLNAYDNDLIKGTTQLEKYEYVMGLAVITANVGATTIGDMGTVIGRVAPLANQAGVSLEEMFAAIAAITSTGTQTSEAISGLKAAISSIVSPSESAKAVAQGLGLEFNAAALEAKGLKGFLADVTKAVKEQGPALYQHKEQLAQQIAAMEQAAGGQKQFKEQLAKLRSEYSELSKVEDGQLAIMAALVGSIEGLNSVLALTSSGGAQKFEQALEQMKDGAASLNETFERWKAENPEFAYRQAKEAISRLAIEIGTMLLPALRDAAQALLPVVSGISNFVKEHQTAAKVITYTIGVIGGLTLVLGPLVYSFRTLTAVLGVLSALKIGTLFTSMATGLGLTAGAAGAASAALGMVGSALGVAAIAGLILLPVIAAVVNSYRDLKAAREQEQETHAAYLDAKRAEARQWAVLGIEIDKVKYNQMSAGEQQAYWLSKEQEFIEKKRVATATMTEEEVTALNKRLANARKGIEEETSIHAGSMAIKDQEIAATQGLAAAQTSALGNHIAGMQQAGAVEQTTGQQSIALTTQQVAAYQEAETQKQAMVDSGLWALEQLSQGESETTKAILAEYGLRQGQEKEAMAAITSEIEGALNTQTGLYSTAANDQTQAAREGGHGVQNGLEPGITATGDLTQSFADLPPEIRDSLQQAGVDISTFSNQAVWDLNQVTAAAQEAANWSMRHSPSILDRMKTSMGLAQGVYGRGMDQLVGIVTTGRNRIWTVLGQNLTDSRVTLPAPATFEQATRAVAAQTRSLPISGARGGSTSSGSSSSAVATRAATQRSSGNGSNVVVNFNMTGPITVRKDADIQHIGERLAAEVRRDMERMGKKLKKPIRRTNRIPRRVPLPVET